MWKDKSHGNHIKNAPELIGTPPQKQAMLVRQLEDEVVKAKTHASQTNPEVRGKVKVEPAIRVPSKCNSHFNIL